MTVVLVLSISSILISLWALWVSIQSRRFTRRQVEIMQAAQQLERATEHVWAEKFDSAVSAVQRIGPSWTQTPHAKFNTCTLVFPEPDLVDRIERYLIDGTMSRAPVRARQIHAADLRLTVVRETITQALECVDEFKRNWPHEAAKLKL